MKNRDERMKELETEEFYLILFKGTQTPENPQYERIVVFNDVYFLDDENGSKSYNDTYFIKKIEELVVKNLSVLEDLSESDCEEVEYPKSSSANEIHIRLDGITYNIDRNLLNDEKEVKFYDEFMERVEEILK